MSRATTLVAVEKEMNFGDVFPTVEGGEPLDPRNAALVALLSDKASPCLTEDQRGQFRKELMELVGFDEEEEVEQWILSKLTLKRIDLEDAYLTLIRYELVPDENGEEWLHLFLDKEETRQAGLPHLEVVPLVDWKPSA